jgi:hypothetical protein
MMYQGSAQEPKACGGRLFCVWGCYSLAMVWMTGAMTAAGFPQPAIWAAAALVGLFVALKTGAA